MIVASLFRGPISPVTGSQHALLGQRGDRSCICEVYGKSVLLVDSDDSGIAAVMWPRNGIMCPLCQGRETLRLDPAQLPGLIRRIPRSFQVQWQPLR